jgi:ABC-2 type transport system ATP-binding protein
VGILRSGKLLFEGKLESLLVGRAVPAYRLHLRSPAQPVADALRRQDWVVSVEQETQHRLHLSVRSLSAAEKNLPVVLADAGAQVISMGPEAADLEDVFLELTS